MRQKILVIEDHPNLRESTGELLEYYGYEAISAENGLQGLDLAKVLQPALIMSHLRTPGMDGDELAARLQEDPATRHIPLILASGSFSSNLAPGCPAGVVACLAKPYDEDVLLACIARFCGPQ
jgi:CheY-like chemotaxis protein